MRTANAWRRNSDRLTGATNLTPSHRPYAGRRSSAPGFGQRLRELVAELSGPNLKTLAESLGATKSGKKKDDWIPILLSALQSTTPGGAASAEVAITGTSSQGAKIARFMEIVTSLKSKADGPNASYDEIDAELRSLEVQMDRDEAIAIAKGVGIVRHLKTRNEAIEEIHHKVFEMKRARESIAY